MAETLDAELLRTFTAIVDTGSFTAAADRVHRTQSAVSMQMKRLEELLGRPLFQRQGRGAVLTPDGELLLGHARRILAAHRETLDLFREAELEGELTLGTPDDYVNTFLPGILTRFAETHPRIHVNVVCEGSSSLEARLAEGQVDLALVTLGHGDDSGVVVYREGAVWVTSASHDTQHQVPLPLALFQPGCMFRRWALEHLSSLGRPFRVAYSSVSVAGLVAAVRGGLAVSVLARNSVVEGMRILEEDDGFPALPNYEIALRRAPGADSPLLQRLEGHILDWFRAGGLAEALTAQRSAAGLREATPG